MGALQMAFTTSLSHSSATMKSLAAEALGLAGAYVEHDDLACFLNPKHPYANDGLVHRCAVAQEIFPKRPSPGLNLADFEVASARIRTMVAWVRDGMPVFQLAPGLVSSLVHTDCESVEPLDVRPAFNAFCVNIPDRFWHSGGSPVRYLLFSVNMDIDQAGLERLKFNPTWSASGGRAPLSDLHRICLSLSQPALETVGLCANGSTLYDRRYLNSRTSFYAANVATIPGGSSLNNLDSHENRLMTLAERLWINLNLYIAERGRGKLLSRPPEARASRRRAASATHPRSPMVWLIGKEVPLDRNLYEAARACETVAGYRIAARFTVRGHWRNQACGTARAERKLTWIKPYWKGPAEGERIAHLYTSGSENDANR